MGLRAKFNLVILAAFAVGFLIAAIVLNRVANDSESLQQPVAAPIRASAGETLF